MWRQKETRKLSVILWTQTRIQSRYQSGLRSLNPDKKTTAFDLHPPHEPNYSLLSKRLPQSMLFFHFKYLMVIR